MHGCALALALSFILTYATTVVATTTRHCDNVASSSPTSPVPPHAMTTAPRPLVVLSSPPQHPLTRRRSPIPPLHERVRSRAASPWPSPLLHAISPTLARVPPCLVPRPHVPLTPSLAHPPLAISLALGVHCHHTDSRPHIPLAPPIYPALSSLSRRHSSIPLDGHMPPRPLLPRTVLPTLADARPLLLRAVSPTLVPAPPHMAPSPSHPSLRHRSPTPLSQEHPRPRAASPS